MIKIYHNPRCTKSSQGIALLKEQNLDFEEIRYLDKPLSKQDLKDLIAKLNIPAIDLVRKNEAIWKSQFKGKDLSEDAIIDVMLLYPKFIERPIVVNGDKAVIGRPTEQILSIL